jgi:hypothetical protein
MSYNIDKVTPRPWQITGQCRDFCGYEGCDRTWLSAGHYYQGSGFTPDDAAHIVHCVNQQETLLNKLRYDNLQATWLMEYIMAHPQVKDAKFQDGIMCLTLVDGTKVDMTVPQVVWNPSTPTTLHAPSWEETQNGN